MIFSPKIRRRLATPLSAVEINRRLLLLPEKGIFYLKKMTQDKFSWQHKPTNMQETERMEINGKILDTGTERIISLYYFMTYKYTHAVVISNVVYLFFIFMLCFFFYKINTQNPPEDRMGMNLILGGFAIVFIMVWSALAYLFIRWHTPQLDKLFMELLEAKRVDNKSGN